MAKEEQIKTSIDLTGEKEYRAACNSINSSLREINSEMKLATAEFADNASGAEALTKKQEILQKQLAEQAKKAEAAEEAAAEDAAPVEEEEPPHALSAALMVTAPEASRKLRREIFLIMKNLLQWFS